MKLLVIITLLFTSLGNITAQSAKANQHRLKVGLVLGGGGAKGACEVGALKVIEQAGIPIDYIAGTSIGSIIGGLYSIGYRAEELDFLLRSQEWADLFLDITLKKGKMVDFLARFTPIKDSINFDSLPIPFRCVATDVKQHREVVFSNGSLPLAMRASMSIPGVFKPVKLDSMLLVDGGMLNNLPVDVVRAMGADVVIAIDLTQNKHENKNLHIKDIPGIGGIVSWLASRPDWEKYNANRVNADVYINPKIKGHSAMSFDKQSISEMITIGEKATRKHLKDLKSLHKRIYKN